MFIAKKRKKLSSKRNERIRIQFLHHQLCAYPLAISPQGKDKSQKGGTTACLISGVISCNCKLQLTDKYKKGEYFFFLSLQIKNQNNILKCIKSDCNNQFLSYAVILHTTKTYLMGMQRKKKKRTCCISTSPNTS